MTHHQSKHVMPLRRIEQIHLIGIAGVGMCGIAEVLLNQGFRVSGSDVVDNTVTQRLTRLGATIYFGHEEKNIEGAHVVVRSTAIDETNPEIIAARNNRIPIVPRAEMLAELMRGQFGIAIAGTHGKTTTTSLVASVLGEAGLDPTYVIGGRLTSSGTNAKLGESPYFVAEADESDASFLFLTPTISVVTNIDMDHMGTYEDDFDRLQSTFIEFLHHLPFYGLAILCIDDPVVKQLLPEVARPFMTYGFNKEADVYVTDWQQNGTQSTFTVVISASDRNIPITLNLPGRHNVLNAVVAVIVALELGVSEKPIQQALLNFQGIGRRFQQLGHCQFTAGKATLIDDYAHHPREISATIHAMRAAWPKRRCVLVFQPHRYSRTQDLFDDFVTALSEVDQLILLDIYPAGEAPVSGISSQALSRAVRQLGKIEPIYVTDYEDLEIALNKNIKDDDVLLTLGAGSIGRMALQLANKFGE